MCQSFTTQKLAIHEDSVSFTTQKSIKQPRLVRNAMECRWTAEEFAWIIQLLSEVTLQLLVFTWGSASPANEAVVVIVLGTILIATFAVLLMNIIPKNHTHVLAN